MTDYPGSHDASYGPRHDRRHGDWQRTADRLLAWMKSRPGESWAFFAAGFVLAALLT